MCYCEAYSPVTGTSLAYESPMTSDEHGNAPRQVIAILLIVPRNVQSVRLVYYLHWTIIRETMVLYFLMYSDMYECVAFLNQQLQ